MVLEPHQAARKSPHVRISLCAAEHSIAAMLTGAHSNRAADVALKNTYRWYTRNHRTRTAGFDFDDEVLAMAKAGSPASV
jgi:hypothetical protein